MPQIEERKLISLGNSSTVVALPIGWLRYYNLQKGDKVILISNGIVKIKPVKKNKSSQSNQKKDDFADIKNHIDATTNTNIEEKSQ